MKEAERKKQLPSFNKLIEKARQKEGIPQDFPPEQTPEEEFKELSIIVNQKISDLSSRLNAVINDLNRMEEIKPEDAPTAFAKKIIETCLNELSKIYF